MNLKQIIVGSAILLGLSSPAYCKMYNPGLETHMEKNYNVDLVGDFSRKEVRKIKKVMKKVEAKINRKEMGIEYLTIENIKALGQKMWEDEELGMKYGDIVFGHEQTKYAAATVDTDQNLIKMDSKAIDWEKIDPRLPLSEYEDLVAHEIGHIVHRKHPEKKEMWEDFFGLSVRRDTEKEGPIPDGYVSAYPLTHPFFTRPDEDIAETFSYWVGNKKYAADDKIVQKKIKKLIEHFGK